MGPDDYIVHHIDGSGSIVTISVPWESSYYSLWTKANFFWSSFNCEFYFEETRLLKLLKDFLKKHKQGSNMKLLDEIKNEISKLMDDKLLQARGEFIGEVAEFKRMIHNSRLRPIRVVLKEIEQQPGTDFFHYKFPDVLKCVQVGLPVFMTGDAGSGKTTIAEQCAKVLGLSYYCMSVCIQTSETAFLGYKNATGAYVPTLFREAYENGGVFLVDEIDNGNPNVISVLNAALSNDVCAFPNGMVHKHPNFRLMASGNTIGRGADRKYVGRLEMDLATLDRFCVITVDYDHKIESSISNVEIADKIQKIRHIVFEKKIRLIVSPRASIHITRLMQQDISYEDALEMCVFKGCDRSIKDQIPSVLLKG